MLRIAHFLFLRPGRQAQLWGLTIGGFGLNRCRDSFKPE